MMKKAAMVLVVAFGLAGLVAAASAHMGGGYAGPQGYGSGYGWSGGMGPGQMMGSGMGPGAMYSGNGAGWMGSGVGPGAMYSGRGTGSMGSGMGPGAMYSGRGGNRTPQRGFDGGRPAETPRTTPDPSTR